MLHLIVSHKCSPFNCSIKIVFTRKKKPLNKRQCSRLDDPLNKFIIGNGNTLTTMENEVLVSQGKDHHENFEKIVDNASQIQVIGSILDDRNKNADAGAVIAAKNRMHEAILTAMNNVFVKKLTQFYNPAP